MVSVRGLCRRFSRLAKVAAQKQFRCYDKWKNITTDNMADTTSQAVSDGELNMSTRGCGGSSSSLSGSPGGETGSANRVLSWAVSFEKLLEDPCGVHHFTGFLKSEVSAENILFWQACEKFRKIPGSSVDELKEEAHTIYNTYLSESSPYPVNIDDTAKTQEKDLEQPTPDLFNKAQAQIFKLMKMDSYRRFVRSPLYQSCTLASVEGKLLPQPDCMASLDNVATLSPSCDGKKNDRSSPSSPDQGGGGGSRIAVEGGYCCVYLPDGSASLAPSRNGQLIKDMLSSLCEKRGFPLKDVVIYLHGKDKQPLSVDQDCSVIRDQQITLELRVKFALEIAFTGKTVGIMAKSSKTLQDALSAVLQKHNLKPQDASVTIAGSDDSVNMTSTVFKLANKMLRLDKIKGRDTSRAGGTPTPTKAGTGSPGGLVARPSLQADGAKFQTKPRKNRDIDGFLDMLTRAQSYRVDDQRGLLTKEQLEVPLFLQLSSDEGTEPEDTSTTSSTTAKSNDKMSLTQCSTGAEGGTPDSVQPKDLRETTV